MMMMMMLKAIVVVIYLDYLGLAVLWWWFSPPTHTAGPERSQHSGGAGAVVRGARGPGCPGSRAQPWGTPQNDQFIVKLWEN